AFGASDFLTNMFGTGWSFFDVMSTVFGEASLSIGAFFIALFTAYIWGIRKAITDIESEDNKFPIGKIWGFILKYIAPFTIIIVFVYTVYATFAG
ncbi:MAG: hypothetical protein GY863_08610, partial [bacterium]|nr:hypothetical protein [bacterium]